MRNLAVHWSEGMFLRPQHFQAADRYWLETLEQSEAWDHAYNYGIRRIELSEEAIANFQVQVNHCQARMKDGTLVSLEAGQEPDRVDLKPSMQTAGQAAVDLTAAFASVEVVRVFLAVPKLKIGSVNVAANDDAGKQRFIAQRQSLQDESQGGNDQEVGLRRMNVRILLSTDDLSGYEVLPIAQIQRAGERAATPRLDPNYFPPMLAVDAWPALALHIVRAIYDIVGKKIEVLGEQVVNRNIGFESQEPGDLTRLFMLSRLNEASTTLGVLAFASGVHPREAYTELCRLVGQLSVFDLSRRPPEIPRYDHDDLARIFLYIKEKIERLINSVRDYEYEQRFFVGVGLGMQVTLEPKWFNSDWQWYVGVSGGELSETECHELLSAGQLDWKLGSSRQVEILFKHRAEGLQLVPLDRPPRALPAGRDWNYYQVSRQDAAWKDVQETQTLAMRLKESLIVNRDKLSGERKLIVASRGRQAVLQFALFAVPTHL
ncbi:MAG TPA: type VI secretion system baseplate subunit TssK [Pirellulales bacterium]